MSFDPSTIRARLRDLAQRDRTLEEIAASADDPALHAYLRAAPADETTFRDVFSAVADRLDPRLAWSIAQATMEHVGDGDAGSATRYAMRRAALVRWASVVGEDAMPEVLAAISEDAETGLTALEAVARHAETRCERVLADVRPYLGHSSVARHPALAAIALQALGMRREDAPKAIAIAWDEAAITEAAIVASLVALGLGPVRLSPSDGRRRVGRDLAIDVLIRAHVVAWFDTESGFSPAPYAALLEETLVPLARELAPVEARVETSDGAHTLRLAARGVVVDERIDDAGDYYDVDRLLALWNALFTRAGSASRFCALATGDQTALVMCAPPKAARALAKAYRLKILRAS